MKRKKDTEVKTKTPVTKATPSPNTDQTPNQLSEKKRRVPTTLLPTWYKYYIFKPRLITRLEQGVDLFAKENDVPGERQQGEAGVSRSDTSAGESGGHSNISERPPQNEEKSSQNKEKPSQNKEKQSQNKERQSQNEEKSSQNKEKPSQNEEKSSQNKEKCGSSTTSTSTREAGKTIAPGNKERESVKPYKCDKCGRHFRNGTYLSEHKQTHVPGARVDCPECGKVFACKVALLKHQKRHEANSRTSAMLEGFIRKQIDGGWPHGTNRACDLPCTPDATDG
ncbi:hypothetical protein A6R68_03038, partial [Neotoma lepida]